MSDRDGKLIEFVDKTTPKIAQPKCPKCGHVPLEFLCNVVRTQAGSSGIGDLVRPLRTYAEYPVCRHGSAASADDCEAVMRNMRDVTIDELFYVERQLGMECKRIPRQKGGCCEWTFAKDEKSCRCGRFAPRAVSPRDALFSQSYRRVVVNGIPDGILRPISHCKESA